MLTSKQYELFEYIQSYMDENGTAPSFEEMKMALNLRSKSGVHRLISALEERKFIRRLHNRARALELVKRTSPRDERSPSNDNNDSDALARVFQGRGEAANDIIELPLHGRIAAGAPIIAIEDTTSLSVPAALLGPGEHYALVVSGDSMCEAGILDGDYALIRKSDVARNGEIVVALVNNDEATLKYFSKDKDLVRLDPANHLYTSQTYKPNQVQVQGKLAGILRRYN